MVKNFKTITASHSFGPIHYEKKKKKRERERVKTLSNYEKTKKKENPKKRKVSSKFYPDSPLLSSTHPLISTLEFKLSKIIAQLSFYVKSSPLISIIIPSRSHFFLYFEEYFFEIWTFSYSSPLIRCSSSNCCSWPSDSLSKKVSADCGEAYVVIVVVPFASEMQKPCQCYLLVKAQLRHPIVKMAVIMGRFTWTDENSRIMLKILNDEKNKGVSKYNWNGIAKIFSAQTESVISEKQASNHHSDKKEQYKAWEELQNLTGISFDPRTNKVDVQEESLERYKAFLERNRKYGLKLVKSELPNVDLLTQLFDGKSAHGVGGCFSPAMGKGSSYLTNNLEGLNIDESSGDNEDEEDNVDDQIVTLSGDESKSPPRSVSQKVSKRTCLKRKSEVTSQSVENKRRQASFDSVIQLLSGIGSSSAPSKAQLVSAELTRMQVAETNGDDYFVQAIRYLSNEKHSDNFLALQNDNQKWIYLKGVDTFFPNV